MGVREDGRAGKRERALQRANVQTMIKDFEDLCNMIHIQESEIVLYKQRLRLPLTLYRN